MTYQTPISEPVPPAVEPTLMSSPFDPLSDPRPRTCPQPVFESFLAAARSRPADPGWVNLRVLVNLAYNAGLQAADWPIGYCPSVRPATAVDGDRQGLIQILLCGVWVVRPWDDRSSPDAWWKHTPRWRPAPPVTIPVVELAERIRELTRFTHDSTLLAEGILEYINTTV